MRTRGTVAGPLILIGIGFLFLLRVLSPEFSIGHILATYWPYLLILWGALHLLEITIRFLSGSPIPVNGVSGGGWVLVVLISLVGLSAFEARRLDPWWRRAGFEQGVEMFGEPHDYEVPLLKQAAGKSPKIVFENFRGDAKITGADVTDVSVTGHKTIRALASGESDKANSLTPVEVVREGDNIIIRCNQQKAKEQSRVTTDLQVTVPRNSTIEANGRQGDFEVTDVNGDVDIVSDSAGVRIQNVSGNVHVDTRRGDIVRCTNVKGNVDVKGRGTDVELERISGPVTVTGRYSGVVSLRGLARGVHIDGMDTELKLDKLPGQVRLERGSLNVQNADGPMEVSGKSTDIEISGFNDSLIIQVEKGDIDLRPGKLPLAKMSIRTRSGNVDLAVPDAAKFDLQASTSHGNVENEFGEPLKQVSYGNSGSKLEGIVGGGPALSLTTSRGTITVRKASADDSKGTGTLSSNDNGDDDRPLDAPGAPPAPKAPRAPQAPKMKVGKPVDL